VTDAANIEKIAKAHVDETEAAREEAQKAVRDTQSELDAGRALMEKTTERLHRQEMSLSRIMSERTVLNDRLWDTYELTYAGARDACIEYRMLRERGETRAVSPEEIAARAAAETAPAEGDAPEQNPAAEPTAMPVATPTSPLTSISTSASALPSDLTPAPTAEVSEPAAVAEDVLPEDFDEAASDSKAQEIRDRIKRMGNVNVGAIDEYARLRERVNDLNGQKADLEQAKQDLEALIADLLNHMRTIFTDQFAMLQTYFEETFTRLFGGGHGEIRLSDPEDPLNCGIDIIVQPPGKKRQILSLFSGGERALTAIAILFAMLKLRPTPFCILDEIEAALDEANITYFADYLKEFSKSTQFVVVTHRKGTMERCDNLFGVAMEERGVSSMVSVSLKDYA
jgi:chromosome segregation ATPase